jgi:Cft2 family RNA processing exonuclease
MRLTNLTRNLEIGANSYLLEIDGRRVVLDCGMHPQHTGDESLPDLKLAGANSIDAVLVSHAHHDHIGSLPVLLRHQDFARILMTEPTRRISDAMLHNSVNVMMSQKEELGLPNYPLFTHGEVEMMIKRTQSVPLRQPFSLDGERLPAGDDSEVAIEFHHAGHILGSAGILIRHKGKRLFYTGDVNFEDQTVSRAARFPEEPFDALIIECTRGDTPVPEGMTRASEVRRFRMALQEALQHGCVLIPVFALGKTQEILAMLHGMFQRNELPEIPLYIGGLSTKITVIHDDLAHSTPRHLSHLNLMEDVKPFIVGGRNRQPVIRKGRIFALTSGMMTEKTLSNTVAERFLDNPDHSIFFVGYADPETPGGRLQAAGTGGRVQLGAEYPEIEVHCDVQKFNFSGHASRESLIDYVKHCAPKKVLPVHGDPAAITWMRDTITRELPGTEVILPEHGMTIEV